MPILFDASIYIAAMRLERDAEPFLRRWSRESPLWLSAVVLEELYAGASPADFRVLERLERDFEKARRLLVPNLSDWSNAGKMLAWIAQKYGYEQIGRGRLTNDALIAASAARTGITVLTLNRRDFARLADLCPVRWQVRNLSGL